MIVQLESCAFRDRHLFLFDRPIDELFDPSAVNTDDMIVMRALIELVNPKSALEMMARHQPGRFELREHAVDCRESDIEVGIEQTFVDFFGREMALRSAVTRLVGARFQDFENSESRRRDLYTRLA